MLKFETAIKEHQYHCESVGMSPKTLRSYRNTPRLFFRWVEKEHGIKDVEKITKYHFQEYFKFKLESGMTRVYVLSIHKNLKAMFDYLYDEEIILSHLIEKLKYIKTHHIS